LGKKWAAGAKAWSDGAADAWDALFAEDCVWDSPQGRIAGSAAVVAALDEIRKAVGWESHELVSGAEAGDLLALLGRNTFASGATTDVAAAIRFVNGKVTEIRSIGGLPEGS
jgi:ketosteroid isomerase-like protein